MAVFIAELFAFAVIIWVLWRYVVPPVRAAMRQRQDQIRAQFDEAREAKEAAEAEEAKYRRSASEARSEAAEIVESARHQSEQIVEELRAKAEQEADRVAERGRQQLAAERDSLVRQLRAQTGTQVVELATRIVGDALADEARRAGTVQRFLDELDQRAAEQPAASRTAQVGR